VETFAFVVGPLLGVYVALPALLVILAATFARSKRPLWVGLGLVGVSAVTYHSYWSAFWVSWDSLDAGHRPRPRVETVETLSLYGCAVAILSLVALAALTGVRRMEKVTDRTG
jgi:hypothetical protein